MIRQFFIVTTCLLCTTFGYAAAIQSTTPASSTKSSLIEQALDHQKKMEPNTKLTNDIPMSAAINKTPSQSFLAAQNQKFSRLLQSLFSTDNS